MEGNNPNPPNKNQGTNKNISGSKAKSYQLDLGGLIVHPFHVIINFQVGKLTKVLHLVIGPGRLRKDAKTLDAKAPKMASDILVGGIFEPTHLLKLERFNLSNCISGRSPLGQGRTIRNSNVT